MYLKGDTVMNHKMSMMFSYAEVCENDWNSIFLSSGSVLLHPRFTFRSFWKMN